jgi:2-(1,2-epoxy-1,2-dihydrophenyl)acetyl-CoA isomerase
MTTPRVQLQITDDVAEIRLTRADAHNAIDPQWIRDFDAAVSAAIAPGAARAILIVADGPSFTVGGDLDHFTDNTSRLGVELRDMITIFHGTLGDLAEAPLPVVCAAQGPAAGGGLGLLWAADVVVAGEDLKVATGFARIGLTGDGGWSYYLPRLVGIRRAQEIVIEGRVLSAAEALDWNLVTRVVPVADVEAEGRRTAQRLAAGPTIALGEMRRLLRESWGATVREQLGAELDAMAAIGTTADAAEGVTSFSERRPPAFRNA